MRESEIIIIIFKYNFTNYKKHLWYIFLNFESIVYTQMALKMDQTYEVNFLYVKFYKDINKTKLFKNKNKKPLYCLVCKLYSIYSIMIYY